MKRTSYILLLSFIILLCLPYTAYSQCVKDSVSVYYPKGSSKLNLKFRDNGVRMKQFIERTGKYAEDSSYFVLRVDFYSQASPEGKVSLNKRLSYERGKEITSFLTQFVSFVDSVVFVTSLDEDWAFLRREVREAHNFPCKEEVVSIMESSLPDDEKEKQLKKVGGGKPWSLMLQKFFPQMRRADVVITLGIVEPYTNVEIAQLQGEEIFIEDDHLHFNMPELRVDTLPLPRKVSRNWYLKTNVAGLGMLVANLAGEVDLGRGFSFALPVYYSAWNYFTEDVKFRTFTIQPELRYWFVGKSKGLYGGIHAGLGWFNVATGGQWRKQDKDGKTPAIGGGVSAGYRVPLGKGNSRWMMEFSAGAGIYSAEYEVFHNYSNGTLNRTEKKTYIGLDQLAVNLIYKLPYTKRGNKGRGSK